MAPGFRRTLASFLDKVKLTGGRGGLREVEGRIVIQPPLALASGGRTGHRARHWLCSESRRKGHEGVGFMMKESKVVTGQVAQSLSEER